MNTLKDLFVKPFSALGYFWGTVDVAVKLLAFFVWAYLVAILASLMWLSFKLDSFLLTQLWWLAYCFIIFFGASLLAYILIFLRNYNEPMETDEETLPQDTAPISE